MEKGSSSISNPIPSSTVILIRDVGKGPEILLVLRHKKASFGANYVFPGGTLESIDEGAFIFYKKKFSFKVIGIKIRLFKNLKVMAKKLV